MKKAAEKDVLKDLYVLRDEAKAKSRSRFFQTHKGGYGEGDLFLGLTVPQQRSICKKYYKILPLDETEKLLKNKYHEARFVAVAALTEKYKRAGAKEKKEIVKIYLRNTKHINNWDLVDVSAPYVTGEFWFCNPGQDLWKMSKSKNLWEQRISVLSTFYFIRQGRFEEILKLSELFLRHEHDLMHKAVGWMLREAGKRDISVLYGFLDKHYKKMPRTMLRCAVEKLPQKKRGHYMEK